MTLGIFQLSFLFIAAIATAFINVVAAIGGGMTLFVIMVSMLNYAVVIPLHGSIQMWSSVTRVWLFRKYINYRLMSLFTLAYIPSAVVGMFFWKTLIEQEQIQPFLKIALGVYLILFLGDWSFKIRTTDRKKLMLYAGGWSGIFAMTVGSPAPVMAPCFMKANLYKEEFIGSWACGGVIVHLSKIPLFYFVWDAMSFDYIWLIILLTLGVILGANFGKAALGKISETLFRKLLVGVLGILAAKLIFWDGIRALFFAPQAIV
jgi:uncharacterized membrane protein YfcA